MNLPCNGRAGCPLVTKSPYRGAGESNPTVHRPHSPARVPRAAGGLATNLRWSWHPETQDLFARIDPALWDEVGHDPVRLLGEVPAARWAELAADADFVGHVRWVADGLATYLTGDRWYQSLGAEAPTAIAYFSPEFGITEVLPQYSGGLGILAGDHLKSASDLGVPIIGVGLFYRAGYFRQSLSASTAGSRSTTRSSTPTACRCRCCARPTARPSSSRSASPAAAPCTRTCGRPTSAACRCCCSTPTSRRTTAPSARSPTASTAAAASTACSRRCCSASAACARSAPTAASPAPRSPRSSTPTRATPASSASSGSASSSQQQGLTFDEALSRPCAPAPSSPPTPRCPRASTGSPRTLIEQYFGGDTPRPACPSTACSRSAPRTTRAATRRCSTWPSWACASPSAPTASRELHGEVSRGMFAGLWPGFDEDEVPITSITNGVHAPTWVAREVRDLLAAIVGPELTPRRPAAGRPATQIPDADLWATKRVLRERLVAGRPPPPARLVGAARRVRRRARLDRRRARPRRAHDRLRPPGADLQAAHPHAARPRAAEGACCCTRTGRCSWSSPASRTRPTTAARS